ncbi:stage II sporulation protein M [Clostridium sp. SYSU_GA19001]|uniref:stage II sporulation protein M n=1 Tax=Clostridium caldaquaticum TaxID=2940653 RepID=UPI0020776FFE|nr:stage II sporulation protein M [Clostridium caldaquaticum]MCM8711057.1 stage II sporulation protein M [Clostridium caldaquaticum]
MTNGRRIINFNKHIEDNFWLYIISMLCVFTGIVLGIYAVKYMGIVENENLLSYLNDFTKNIAGVSFQYKNMFLDILKNNFPLIIAIWFLGLTMVGIPVILIIDVIKGFTIGFTISFMIKSFGAKGIGMVLLGVLPQNIIYIPCIMLSSVIAMEFSLNILKDSRAKKHWIGGIGIRIVSYTIIFVMIFAVMCSGFLLETLVTPNLIKFIMS